MHDRREKIGRGPVGVYVLPDVGEDLDGLVARFGPSLTVGGSPLHGAPDGREELFDDERLTYDPGEPRRTASFRRSRPGLGDVAAVRAEHDDRYVRMGPPDRDRVVPRAALAGIANLTVKDDEARAPSLEGGADERVVGDGHRAVAGLIQQSRYEVAQRGVVFDDKDLLRYAHLTPSARRHRSARPRAGAPTLLLSKPMLGRSRPERMTVS